ncbi:MAG: sigma-70 family RNA polymerase sigma factor [Lentisphaerae bacterium]|nr:sigma-70 family RNA polymerase sigma factor [Lentisphaerota bacterium]
MAFTTSKSLLARVRSGDEISWNEFYTSYKPLILLCGYDCHLTEDEKEELVQKVMCEIFQKDILGKYDPENIPSNVVFQHNPSKGRFRHYLRGIIRNQALKIVEKRKEHLSLDDDSGISETLSSPDLWEAVWDEEWRKHVLKEALTELKSRVQSESYASFEMYAIRNRPVQEVADFLNVSVSAVYTAKSRCISELKKIIKELEDR